MPVNECRDIHNEERICWPYGDGAGCTAAPLPTPRFTLAAAAVNGKIYAIGGSNSVMNNNGVSTVEVFDPSTNTWSTASPMPTARMELAAVDANGLLYAIGGLQTNGFVILNTTEQYSPAVTVYTFIKN